MRDELPIVCGRFTVSDLQADTLRRIEALALAEGTELGIFDHGRSTWAILSGVLGLLFAGIGLALGVECDIGFIEDSPTQAGLFYGGLLLICMGAGLLFSVAIGRSADFTLDTEAYYLQRQGDQLHVFCYGICEDITFANYRRPRYDMYMFARGVMDFGKATLTTESNLEGFREELARSPEIKARLEKIARGKAALREGGFAALAGAALFRREPGLTVERIPELHLGGLVEREMLVDPA